MHPQARPPAPPSHRPPRRRPGSQGEQRLGGGKVRPQNCISRAVPLRANQAGLPNAGRAVGWLRPHDRFRWIAVVAERAGAGDPVRSVAQPPTKTHVTHLLLTGRGGRGGAQVHLANGPPLPLGELPGPPLCAPPAAAAAWGGQLCHRGRRTICPRGKPAIRPCSCDKTRPLSSWRCTVHLANVQHQLDRGRVVRSRDALS